MGYEDLREVVAEFWQLIEKANLELLESKNLSPDDIWERPKKIDPEAVSYCRFCLVEYRSGYEKCADCDEPLILLKSP